MYFTTVFGSPILLSLLAGQSLDQFAFTEDFSFSIGGTSALMTILLAAVIEEVGWRGYGEDSVASYFSWFTESVIFGKEMFFEKEHIGNLLEYREARKIRE